MLLVGFDSGIYRRVSTFLMHFSRFVPCFQISVPGCALCGVCAVVWRSTWNPSQVCIPGLAGGRAGCLQSGLW